MSPSPSRTARPHPRGGFSLVELLVVIVIIGILMALILPALGAARRSAQVAKVQVELKNFESDITSFKTEFGIAPPSSIILSEDGTWGHVPSKTFVRRLWPQFDFTAPHDFNGDGDRTDSAITLTGPECLVFFLSGILATDVVGANGALIGTAGTQPTEWTPLGFSKNPRNPFERSGGTRIGPFHEFDGGRMVNLVNSGQGMPEYLDPLPSQSNPYIYISSNEGKGYDTNDLPPGTLNNVYLQKDDNPGTVGDPSEVAWNQSSFQIISPGFDTLYGAGGFYEADNPQLLIGARRDEQDNITNFAGQLSN